MYIPFSIAHFLVAWIRRDPNGDPYSETTKNPWFLTLEYKDYR
jgi:hypothetical protein